MLQPLIYLLLILTAGKSIAFNRHAARQYVNYEYVIHDGYGNWQLKRDSIDHLTRDVEYGVRSPGVYVSYSHSIARVPKLTSP